MGSVSALSFGREADRSSRRAGLESSQDHLVGLLGLGHAQPATSLTRPTASTDGRAGLLPKESRTPRRDRKGGTDLNWLPDVGL